VLSLDFVWNFGGLSVGVRVVVVVGYVVVYVGIDIGGMVCFLGVWCGVVGFKGLFGCVLVDLLFYVCVVGLLMWIVDDVVWVMVVFVWFDGCDYMSLLLELLLDWGVLVFLIGLCVGLCFDVGVGLLVEFEMCVVVEGVVYVLGVVGVSVELIVLFIIEEMFVGFDCFWWMCIFVEFEKFGLDVVVRVLFYI